MLNLVLVIVLPRRARIGEGRSTCRRNPYTCCTRATKHPPVPVKERTDARITAAAAGSAGLGAAEAAAIFGRRITVLPVVSYMSTNASSSLA